METAKCRKCGYVSWYLGGPALVMEGNTGRVTYGHKRLCGWCGADSAEQTPRTPERAADDAGEVVQGGEE